MGLFDDIADVYTGAKTKKQQQKEAEIEDRKDKRIKMEGTQQSKMIQQRQTDSPAIDFENEPELNMEPFM